MSEVPRGITQEEIRRYKDIQFFSQKEGLKRLFSFLMGEATFAQVSPFTLSLAGRYGGERETATFQFYLGRNRGSDAYLRVGIGAQEVEGGVDTLYVVPNQLIRGRDPYYWLNFYGNEPQNVGLEKFPLVACRLRPDEPDNKIDFQGWHNLGEQLIADYLAGSNNVVFEDLLPFMLYAPQKMSLANYRLGADSRFIVSIYENRLIEDKDTLRFIPSKGELSGYEWVDVLKEIPELSEGRSPIASYRMFAQEHRFTTRGWFGYERQLLLDHLSGDPNVKFEDLRPIRAMTTNYEAINLGMLNGKQLPFYFPFEEVGAQVGVVLMPRQDPRRRYQWLELYRAEPTTGDPQGEYVSSGRIMDGKIENKSWQGPERQLLKDFVSGEADFEDLKPIPLSRAKTDVLTLWKDKDKKVYIVLSRKFGLKQGDCLTLVPLASTEEYIEFDLTKNQRSLGRYRFDVGKQLFQMEELFYSDDGFLYDKHHGAYLDEEGETWIPMSRITKRYGYSATTVKNNLVGVRIVNYRTKGNGELLYNLSDIERFFENWSTGVDSNTGIYTDSDNIEWAPLIFFWQETGLPLNIIVVKLRNIVQIKGMRAKKGKGRQPFLYKVIEAREKLQSFISLPEVDSETGRYIDTGGEWVSAQDLAAEYGVAVATVVSRAQEVRTMTARKKGWEITLYHRAEFARAFYEKLQTEDRRILSTLKVSSELPTDLERFLEV